MAYAERLREELSVRAMAWAKGQDLAHECTTGDRPAVIFHETAAGQHGNFHPASYARIRSKPEWNRRLQKSHTSARRILVSHDTERRELDTATSSDALLMNVFCHPKAFATGGALRSLLCTEAPEQLQFGHKPRIPLHSNHVECSEVDLRIGDLLIEAKLTEGNFQTAPRARVERYRGLDEAFSLHRLPRRDGDIFLHYQLIRGVMAAFASETIRYCVICDARRPDLIEAWFAIIAAVKEWNLRSRLQLATWQEIAQTLPVGIGEWLREKYGINDLGDPT